MVDEEKKSATNEIHILFGSKLEKCSSQFDYFKNKMY